MGILASSSQNEERLYDPIRELWVAATPEEKVRQALLLDMVQRLSYPKALLSVEVALATVGKGSPPARRLDIVSFGRRGASLAPLLIVECKESASLEEKAWQQVLGYNHFVGAPFLAVAHPEGVRIGYSSPQGLCFLSGLPSYSQLLLAVSHG